MDNEKPKSAVYASEGDFDDVVGTDAEHTVPTVPTLSSTRSGCSCLSIGTDMDRPRGFRPVDMYLALLYFVIVSLLTGFLFFLFEPFVFIGPEWFLAIVGIAVFLYLHREIRRKKDRFVDCALAKRTTPRDWGISFLLLAGVMPVAAVARWLNDRLALSLFECFVLYIDPSDAVVRVFAYRGNSYTTFLLLVFSAVILTPINEELWFRGIGMAGYEKTGSRGRSVFWTSVVFGLTHGIGGFMHATVLGFALAAMRSRTGSLYCPMVMHALNNAIALFS